MKSKASRRKEIRKTNRAEIHEIENRKSVKKIYKTKSWFFVKINKIDKPSARWTKKKKEKDVNIRNETEANTTVPME